MGTTSNKLIYLYLFSLLTSLSLRAQQPFINSIAPLQAEVGASVEITGLNLSGTPRVFFGGIEATVISNTNNLITAEVPAGATNAPIYVLNNGEVGQSSNFFFISFGGTSATDSDPEFKVLSGQLAASEFCLCDINNDNKNDIIMVHNREIEDDDAGEVTIYLNNTSGTGAFSGNDFQLSQTLNFQAGVANGHNAGFASVACSDLDNDGDRDLAFTSNSGNEASTIFVLENTNNGIFPNEPDPLGFRLPRTANNDQRRPGAIRTADLDRDGFLDLVVGNFNDPTFHVFLNTQNISFGEAIEFSSNNQPSSLIEIADLNQDGSQDIVIGAFRRNSINIFSNQSSVGNVSFQPAITLTSDEITDLKLGDLNNDGNAEIIVTSNINQLVQYFTNQSTAGGISFGGAVNLNTSGDVTVGLNLGDINGDGLLDIISTVLTGGINIYRNIDGSNFNLDGTKTTAGSTQFIKVGDVNSDAKPDIIYTTDVRLTDVGSIGILLNRNCITPVITPQNVNFCLNDPFTLSTVNSANATYNWQVLSGNGISPPTNGPEAEFTITSGSTAQIRVTVSQDGCSESSTVNLTVTGGTPPTTPTINASSAGVLCIGDAVTLSSSITSDNYFWTLPDGSTENSATIQLNPVTTMNAGTYRLYIQDTGGCISDEVTRTIEVSSAPVVAVINNGLTNFCNDIILEVPDYSGDGITYQWKSDGVNISAATNASVTLSQSGNYSVELTNIDNCTSETDELTITKIDLPNSIISGPSELCVDFTTSYTAASTGASGFGLQYEWLLDGNPVSNDQSIELTFNATGNHTLVLNTSYLPEEVYPGPNANDMCVASETLNLVVSTAPSLTFNVTDGVEKCQGDALTVNLTSPASDAIQSYEWRILDQDGQQITTATSASVEVTTPAGVEFATANVTIETSIGCTVSQSITINNFPSDADITYPDFPAEVGDTIVLEEGISIRLQSNNIVSGFSWEPAELIDNPTNETITFFPQGQFNTITLSGIDNNGCQVSTQVVVELDNLRPKKTFSPNGDGINDCWEILNIEGFQGACEVYIFDGRGRNIVPPIKNFDQGNCIWDGTFSGTPVLEGVYYYVLKCNDDGLSKTGSILLAR